MNLTDAQKANHYRDLYIEAEARAQAAETRLADVERQLAEARASYEAALANREHGAVAADRFIRSVTAIDDGPDLMKVRG